jgi:two-component system sensor histidine kinase PilS (NtrC family)
MRETKNLHPSRERERAESCRLLTRAARMILIEIGNMKSSDQLQHWLFWIIKIRFVIITFVFAIDFALRQWLGSPANETSLRYFGIAIILWYVLGLFYLVYNQLSRDLLLQAYIQICSDIVVITAIVHLTGNLESNFISLYFLAVIMASIALPRFHAFLVAAFSFLCMASVLELAYLPDLHPRFALTHPALERLVGPALVPVEKGIFEFKILASLFGFFAVAYLASYLAESLRKTGRELRDKTGEVASLQALNENIIRSMRGGLITTDLNGSILVVNPAGAWLLGRNVEELSGQPVGALLGNACAPAAGSAYTRREISYRRPDGDERILGISASPLNVPEQGLVGYIYNFQDLTEQKVREAADQLKDRMAMLGRMAAGIAHEIRNPLSSICGSVKLLEDIASMNEDQAKLIDIVSRESARLDKLVSDFLVYSREQRFEFQSVDLVRLLDETLLLLEHHPLFTTALRVARVFPARPVIATVDTDKMRQVFWNICNNSLKAMPQGGQLTAEIQDDNARRVSVILSDDGIGFAPAQLERIFEPFHPHFKDGTGLGLAISYQIIKGHRGEIRVSSKPGAGARFCIDLPRSQEPGVNAN